MLFLLPHSASSITIFDWTSCPYEDTNSSPSEAKYYFYDPDSNKAYSVKRGLFRVMVNKELV